MIRDKCLRLLNMTYLLSTLTLLSTIHLCRRFGWRTKSCDYACHWTWHWSVDVVRNASNVVTIIPLSPGFRLRHHYRSCLLMPMYDKRMNVWSDRFTRQLYWFYSQNSFSCITWVTRYYEHRHWHFLRRSLDTPYTAEGLWRTSICCWMWPVNRNHQ